MSEQDRAELAKLAGIIERRREQDTFESIGEILRREMARIDDRRRAMAGQPAGGNAQ